MDVIQRRRDMLNQGINLKALGWVYKVYLTTEGKIRKDNQDTSSYTKNFLLLKAGKYRVIGYNSAGKTLNYRFHEYTSDDKWIEQVYWIGVPNNSYIDFTFQLDHDAYIRISMGILYFEGSFTKVE